MKSKKVIPLVILTIMVLVLASIGTIFYARESLKSNLGSDKINISDNKEENIKKEIIKSEEEENNIQEVENDLKKEELVNDKNNLNTNTNSDTTNTSINKNEPIVSKQENNIVNNSDIPVKEEQTTQTAKQEIWEKLGVTKEHYYNEPMYSWERVDFKTIQECLEYGDNYIPSINGEESFNCREVVSMSGNLLGIMFDTEKLN